MKIATLIFCALGILLFTSCKKDKAEPSLEEQTQLSADESMTTRETDLVLEDVSEVFIKSSFGDGSPATLCGISVDSSQIASGKIILNYDGSTCLLGSRKRYGSVEAQFSPVGGKWRDAGTSIQLTFTDYKVVRTWDGKSLILNGSKKITNQSGGLPRNLTAVSNPVVYKIKADLRLTFEDGTSRTWRIARKRSASIIGGYYQVSIEGDTTVGGYSLVSTWGTTRTGTVFYVSHESPIVISNRCPREPVSGLLKIRTIFREFEIMYGVDQNGNPTNACPYGYKIEWTDNGKHREKIVEY